MDNQTALTDIKRSIKKKSDFSTSFFYLKKNTDE